MQLIRSKTRFVTGEKNRIPKAAQRTDLEWYQRLEALRYTVVLDFLVCRRVGPGVCKSG